MLSRPSARRVRQRVVQDDVCKLSRGYNVVFLYIYIRNLNLILRMMGSPEQVLNNRVT